MIISEMMNSAVKKRATLFADLLFVTPTHVGGVKLGFCWICFVVR